MQGVLDPITNIGIKKCDRQEYVHLRLTNLVALMSVFISLIISAALLLAFGSPQAAMTNGLFLLLYPITWILNLEGLRKLASGWVLVVFYSHITCLALLVFPQQLHTELLLVIGPVVTMIVFGKSQKELLFISTAATAILMFYLFTMTDNTKLLPLSVKPTSFALFVGLYLAFMIFLVYSHLSELNHFHLSAERNLERDPLTDTLNGYEIYRRSTTLITGLNSTLSVIVIDIDKFQNINNEHGWDKGDLTLVDIANQLRADLADINCHIGRLHADRFVILLPEQTLSDALELAEALKTSIRTRTLLFETGAIQFSAGIGVATRQTDIVDGYRLIDAANSAVRQAKKYGDGKVSVASKHQLQKAVSPLYQPHSLTPLSNRRNTSPRY
ncbi:GGDEF domain-containing protein [Veronia nyctiphanis]|nr:GGDEF domain-containing protein [Veronia nyctiphanis]